MIFWLKHFGYFLLVFFLIGENISALEKTKNNAYEEYIVKRRVKELKIIKKINFVREKLSEENKNKLTESFSLFGKYRYGTVISYNIICHNVAKSLYNKAKSMFKEQNLDLRKRKK